MDINTLDQYIKDGLITRRRHPEFPYAIYNYTAKTQFKRIWDDVTLQCRGLILDDDGNIIARPFKKFFNFDELTPTLRDILNIPYNQFHLNYRVYDKLDGSLGVMYPHPDNKLLYYMASRGSFDSEQARVGTELLHGNWSSIGPMASPNDTYLFEIIYPENRIVVDYGEERAIKLIGVVNVETGKDLSTYYLDDWPGGKCEEYTRESFGSFVSIKDNLSRKNKEGVVLLYENGFRVKIKFDDYIRLHRLMSQCTDRYIVECLKSGVDLEEVISDTPDEFYKEIESKVDYFRKKFYDIKRSHRDFYENIMSTHPYLLRKQIAGVFNSTKHPGILFAMLDNKPCDQIILNIIKRELGDD